MRFIRYLSVLISLTFLLALSPALAANRTPVIDPGHGGLDGGAVSSSGVIESALNLEFALRLKYTFLFLGIEPVMLRESDVSLHSESATTIRAKKASDLKKRVELVEGVGNGLLISVHQNSFSDSRYGGAQIFYVTEATKPLADALQKNINGKIDTTNDRAAKKAAKNIYLFKHITKPAILIECGFLTNAADLVKLQSPEYQKSVVSATAAAFLAFCAEVK